MARRPQQYEAKFLQTLVFSGEPQLILLSVSEISYIIAVAIPDADRIEPYYGAKITSEQLYEYINERFDLRYLMERPAFKEWYIFDLAFMTKGLVQMTRLKLDDDISEKFLPGHGIFAREHTEEFRSKSKISLTEELFKIDGSWDLPEFSQFYNYYTDLYVVYNSVDIFMNNKSELDARRKVQDAFNKPWQGGGSYSSFYDGLLDVQSRQDRLRVGGIQYNSPGFVQVKGKSLPFQQVRELVRHYERNRAQIDEGYKRLRKFLSNNDLLTLRAADFNTKSEIAKEVKVRARGFAKALDAVDFDQIMQLSFNDPLIAAKVLLSIKRRLTKMLEFFSQGRVSFG